MQATLTIGDFSRITHLSIKTLRHYHRVDLLLPSEVNADTGYRYYSLGQVPVALAIRRYRELGMPIDDVRAVLAAPDDVTRDALIGAHLSRLQDQLAQTQTAVVALQALLSHPDLVASIEHRFIPATTVLAITAVIERVDLSAWWATGLDDLRATRGAATGGLEGPAGGLFDETLFTDERGECTLFRPVAAHTPAAGRARPLELPRRRLRHRRTPGVARRRRPALRALGSYVAERGLGGQGPVREHYLVGRDDTDDVTAWRTEICWPL